MAKQLSNVHLFVKGDPAQPAPAVAYMTYDVVEGAASKTNNVHSFVDPDFTKTGADFWDEGVTAAKAVEGIE